MTGRPVVESPDGFLVRVPESATVTEDGDGVRVEVPLGGVQTNSYAFAISRQQAIDHGLIPLSELTQAELGQRAEQHFAYVAKVAADWEAWVPAIAALDSVGELARRLLDLHAPQASQWSWFCGLCRDGDDAADWPCPVTEQIAEAIGVDLPPWMPTTYMGITAGTVVPDPPGPIRDLFPEAFVKLGGIEFKS